MDSPQIENGVMLSDALIRCTGGTRLRRFSDDGYIKLYKYDALRRQRHDAEERDTVQCGSRSVSQRIWDSKGAAEAKDQKRIKSQDSLKEQE